MADFEIDFLPNIWRHPETDVSILGEDMPWELIPYPRIEDIQP